jgi:uncharacterized membrane protein required for colicin V production
MQFSIIDLIIIIILVLLTVFGLIRGFPKKRLVSFALSLGFSVAYLGGIPLSRALMNTDMNMFVMLYPMTIHYFRKRLVHGVPGIPFFIH